MRKRYLFLLFAICPSLAAQSDPVSATLGGLRGRLIGAASETIAKNGEGSTIQRKNGSLLHLFSRHMRPTGDPSKYRNPDLWPAHVASMVSTDGGNSWSEPEILFRSTTGENAMQPSLARLGNGEIGVSYSRIDSLSAATKVFRYSRDEGRTWSDEILISPVNGYWTSAHDRMLTLSNGRVVISLHNKERPAPERMVTQVAYSDDNGRSWRLSKDRLVVDEALPGYQEKFGKRTGFWEGSIVERRDGSLYMIGRTYAGRLFFSESVDKGTTWSKLAPTSLLSSAAPGRVQQIPGTDDLLVVWNSCCRNPADNLLGDRITLSSAISSDGGKTWQWRRVLEDITPGSSNRVEYPAMNIIDGKVFLTYRAQTGSGARGLRMQEYMTILPLAWFYAERDFHDASATLAEPVLIDAAGLKKQFATLPTKPPTNRPIITQEHHVVKAARVENRDGPFERHDFEDRVFYVTSGAAVMRVGGKLIEPVRLGAGDYRADRADGYREMPISTGSVLSVPSGIPYQIVASGTDISFVVVTIRP
jgi:hypothetical protein